MSEPPYSVLTLIPPVKNFLLSSPGHPFPLPRSNGSKTLGSESWSRWDPWEAQDEVMTRFKLCHPGQAPALIVTFHFLNCRGGGNRTQLTSFSQVALLRRV